MINNMDRCVNCGIRKRCNTMKSHSLEDESKLSIIQAWLAPKPVCSEDHVCNECWMEINKTLNDPIKKELSESPSRTTTVGHRLVCVNCGRSLQNKRCHLLRTTNDRECAIHNMIQTWIMPQLLHTQSHVCHSCWVRADRACRRRCSRSLTSSNELGQASPHSLEIDTNNSESRTKEAILLPDYIRAPETEHHCFVEDCKSIERFRLPILLRRMLLSTYNYYVPLNNRICSKHLATESWDFLKNTKKHKNMFNARHIQDMFNLKSMNI